MTQGKSSRTLCETEITADFSYPLCELLPREFRFVWDTVRDPGLAVQRQVLQLRNVTPLPVHVSLAVPPPFSVVPPATATTRAVVVVEAQQTADVEVLFDGLFKNDVLAHKYRERLAVSCEGHTHRDTAEVVGEVYYRNVALSAPRVSFGCVLGETKKTVVLKVTNISSLPVE